MSGFNSLDHLTSQLTVAGATKRTDWNKNTFATTAHTIGMWYCLMRGAGNPPHIVTGKQIGRAHV